MAATSMDMKERFWKNEVCHFINFEVTVEKPSLKATKTIFKRQNLLLRNLGHS